LVFRLLNKVGITPQINDAYRTEADQEDRRANAYKSSLPVATGISYHQLGYAVDIQITGREPGIVSLLVDAGLVWGGEWSTRDTPHFELRPPYVDRVGAAERIEAFYLRCLK